MEIQQLLNLLVEEPDADVVIDTANLAENVK
jgi:hypothetical protein